MEETKDRIIYHIRSTLDEVMRHQEHLRNTEARLKNFINSLKRMGDATLEEPAKPEPSEGDWEVRNIGNFGSPQHDYLFCGPKKEDIFNMPIDQTRRELFENIAQARNSGMAALRAEVEERDKAIAFHIKNGVAQMHKIEELTEQLEATKAEDHQWYIENTTGGDRRVVHSKTQEIYHLRIGKADSPEDAARFVAGHNEPSKPLPDGRPKHKPKGWREAMLSTRLSLWTILEHDGEGNMRHVSCGINDHTARKEASDHNKSRGFSD